MIPIGYMAKQISTAPDWLKAQQVRDIYSVSGCISKYFDDYIKSWKHNGYLLFDSPDLIREVANELSISLEGTKLFYYEAYEMHFDEKRMTWSAFSPEPGVRTEVSVPINKRLEGYDLVSFVVPRSPECSPLSCNGLAEEIPTNSHCLIETFDLAKAALESGKCNNSEPGRIGFSPSIPSIGPKTDHHFAFSQASISPITRSA